ncbi:MAG TPA: DUF1707 domain-containing protein [Streptosporangiaceae bacterium]|nr:DUF1707 domain-containing protein [Streptosporangiaceae bacterium]
MAVGPGNESAGMRTSRTDREQAIEMLKTAFVQDRLTKDELDARVGQALAARTYADLDAVTHDVPVSSRLPPLPRVLQTTSAPLSPHVPRRSEVRRAVTSGTGALGVVIVAVGAVAGVAVNPLAGVAVAVFFVIIAAIAAGFAALVIRSAQVIEERSRRRKRASSSGRTPPGPGPGSHNIGPMDSAAILDRLRTGRVLAHAQRRVYAQRVSAGPPLAR